MTTILALQLSDGCVLAADSQITYSRVYIQEDSGKITRRGEYIIAGAGDVSAGDIAQHIWQPPKPTVVDKKDLRHFIITKVIPSLRNCLADNGYRKADKDDDGWSLIIALCGTLFEIADDYSVLTDSSTYYGIGSGSPYGLGALHHGASLEQALTIADRLDPSTSAPFVYFKQSK